MKDWGQMLRAYIETFKKYQHLLANLITRDLKIKYRRSVLGLLWSLLNPVLMMLILSAVFSKFMHFTQEFYPVYLIAGQTLFTFFSEASNSALESIVSSSALLKKVYVPKYIFPLEKIIYAFVNLLFSLTAVIVILIIYGVPFSPTMFLVPIPLISMLIFTLGFGLLLSATYAFFRDVKHLYSVVLLAWMYLTPIIYPLNELDDLGFIGAIVRINPLTSYVTYFRNVLIYGISPSLAINLICFGWAFFVLTLGLVVFKKTQDQFILHI